MRDFVRPTTANPKLQFYAACMTCGWQVYAPIFGDVHSLSDRHAEQCPDAAVEVDVVQYIGHEKTPAVQQHDEGHSIHLSAGTNAKSSNLAVVGVSVNRD